MNLFMQQLTGLGKLFKEDDELDKEIYKLQEAQSQEQIERMYFRQLEKLLKDDVKDQHTSAYLCKHVILQQFV